MIFASAAASPLAGAGGCPSSRADPHVQNQITPLPLCLQPCIQCCREGAISILPLWIFPHLSYCSSSSDISGTATEPDHLDSTENLIFRIRLTFNISRRHRSGHRSPTAMLLCPASPRSMAAYHGAAPFHHSQGSPSAFSTAFQNRNMEQREDIMRSQLCWWGKVKADQYSQPSSQRNQKICDK